MLQHDGAALSHAVPVQSVVSQSVAWPDAVQKDLAVVVPEHCHGILQIEHALPVAGKWT